MMSLSGCSSPVNRLIIQDYPTHHPEPINHYEDFEEAYFRINDNQLADIVLRKKTGSLANPTQPITQFVYLQSFWKPYPGRTFADATMINVNISYVIFKGDSGVSYEGGGFMNYQVNGSQTTITGRLESGGLQPLRKRGEELTIFDQANIQGRFKAIRDDRRVTKIIHEIERRLGPLPRIHPNSPTIDY